MADHRIERDTLGAVAVPASARWGAQTQRSLENFPFGVGERMPLDIIHALARIKQVAARVNARHGLDAKVSDAIAQAAAEVAEGRFDDQFPLAIWQTGSGTQSNMNVNEVVANRATELLGNGTRVHPNDDVNRAQSSNDCFPTAMHLAAALTTREKLIPALDRLEREIALKSDEWAQVAKIGRTHMQDAAPLTLGQEWSGYADQLRACRSRIEGSLADDIMPLAQGATAVGTGLNAPTGFGEEVIAGLAELTGLPLHPCSNRFAALASHDGLLQFSATLATLAAALNKIANDIRLLGSGPDGGIGELLLPANEPGSSIMPGKVNPTQCEMLTMVSAQVMGNHHAVTLGAMQGQLELNAFKPLIAANLLRSIELLSVGMASFAERCVAGIEPDLERIARTLQASPMIATALVPVLGYERAARLVKHARDKAIPLQAAASELGYAEAADFGDLLQKALNPGSP
jgi:fumarate hydratase, class II